MKGAKLCSFCSAHLCKLLRPFRRRAPPTCLLLLCALVQVASCAFGLIVFAFSSSALRTCASCFDLVIYDKPKEISLLLRALVQVASCVEENPTLLQLLLLCALVQVASLQARSKQTHQQPFCSAHLCKLLRWAYKTLQGTVRFCSAHLCKLLRQNCTVLCVRQ